MDRDIKMFLTASVTLAIGIVSMVYYGLNY
jgi:hypothetical protein